MALRMYEWCALIGVASDSPFDDDDGPYVVSSVPLPELIDDVKENLVGEERVAPIAALLQSVSDEPVVILLLLNVILLILGTFMDMSPLIVITTPIFLPVAVAFGVDPVHFGVILVLNLGIGLCTPPVGAVLFVGCAVGRISIWDAMKTIWPFYGAAVLVLLLVTYIPGLSLWLPQLFR